MILSRRLFLSAAAAVPALGALPWRATEAAQTGWPREIPHERGTLHLSAPPSRVVSTSPSLTGMLLAIGAPLTATAATTPGSLTDAAGFFRQWAGVAHDRGVETLYPDRDFDIEALILSEPDLLIGATSGADSILPYAAEIEAQGLPLMVLDYSATDWRTLARALGQATGCESGAEAAIGDYEARVAAAAARLDLRGRPVTIVGYDLAGTYSIGRSTSPQAEVLAEMGFSVVPLPEAMRSAVTRISNTEFVSHEVLAPAIGAETVLLLSADAEDVAAFLADPLLAGLPAVQRGQVYPMGLSSFRIDYYSALEMIETLEAALGA